MCTLAHAYVHICVCSFCIYFFYVLIFLCVAPLILPIQDRFTMPICHLTADPSLSFLRRQYER